jgi:competence protein ComEC
MTMVAGTAFGLARFALALIPWLALRVPVHKPAAVAGFVVCGGYFLLAGATVPTQRSFLMISAALLAVLADRNPFSLRVLAWAATAVLAMRPEALLGASFQLSFAAVLALMAVYEAVRLRQGSGEDDRQEAVAGALARCARYVLGVAATTVIAGAATAPFTAYHFQNVTTYGVLANLVAVPLTTFWVMPAGLLGLALMPLGLDAPAFALMGAGVDGMLWIARLVAGLPGASLSLPQWPGATLGLVAPGGLWLALWRHRWRLLGLAPLAAAGIVALLARPPDLLVDHTLGMAARRLPDGQVGLLEWERDARRRENWLRALGAEKGERRPVRGGSGGEERDGIACDAAGCLVRLGDRTVVGLARSAGAAVEDCGAVDLLLARSGPERCADRAREAQSVGPRALRASGGLAIRASGGGITVETVAAARGDWPWTRRPARVFARDINS